MNKLIGMCTFDHEDAVREFVHAYAIDPMKKSATREDTNVFRMRAFLRRYIEDTTTVNPDIALPFDCFVDEIMDIYDKTQYVDRAIKEMAEKTLKLVERLGKEAAQLC